MNIGTCPTRPTEQNAKWYGLYKLVADDVTVRKAH